MRGKGQKAGIGKLFFLLEKDRGRYLFFVFANAAFYSVGQLLQAFCTGRIVSVAQEGDLGGFFSAAAMLAGSLCAMTAACFCKREIGFCTDGMNARIREKVFFKIPKLKASWFDEGQSGDAISRVTNDLGAFTPLFSSFFPDIALFLLYGGLSAAAALWVDWEVCILLFVCSFLCKWINSLAGRRVREISKDAYEKNAMLVERLLILLTGVPVIRLFGMQRQIEEQYRRENQEYTRLSVRLEGWKGLQGGANALMTASVMDLAIILGAWLVLFDRISLAKLVVLGQLSSSITKIFWAGPILGEAAAAAVAGNRIRELLKEQEEPERFLESAAGNGESGERVLSCPGLSCGPQPKEVIRFEKVDFSYEGKPVLSGVSFSVRQGETLALTGESGGGKSTVFKLLLGFYEAQKGRIFLYGKPLEAYTRKEARALFSYVSQDCFLFSDSVLENIRCGRPEAGIEEVKRAARLACADGFIEELPEGYDTQVGERAVRLSGGQKQRIAIARALVKDAPILLLDEATSAMDADSQQQVQKALEQLMKGRTVLMIAHRKSALGQADRILTLENGTVADVRDRGDNG